jgi:allantoicase
VSADRAATHVRLDIFPDGGMARLRLHGRPDQAGANAMKSRFESLSRR